MSFFGRKPIIALLQRRVIDLKEGYRQNLALFGPRFIGKTAILEEFISQLNDEKLTCVYLALEEGDFAHFVNQFIVRILSGFLRSKKITSDDNLTLLLEQAQRFLPATVIQARNVLQNLEKDRPADAYRELLNLPDTFEDEAGGFCLIVLDEFQEMEDFGIANVFQELGKKVMVQRKSIYILASSLRAKAQKILTEKLSLLFGNFEIVEVKPFSIETSLEFIEESLKGYALEKSCRNFLVDFTAGHPFYLEIICTQLLRAAMASGQQTVFLNNLIDGLEELLFERWGVLNLHFSRTIESLGPKKSRGIFWNLLYIVACGNNKLAQILDKAGKERGRTALRLNRLVEEELLLKNGNVFCISDKLFGFWLKTASQKMVKGFLNGPVEERLYFKNELKQKLAAFIQTSNNEVEVRIIELLKSFDNELFQLNGRRHRLPGFSRVYPLNFNGNAAQNLKGLIAETQRDKWALLFKEGMILDVDILSFLSATSEKDEKFARRVVISLSEMETNARLRALQEKMWIWSAADMNFILSLFGKSYIVK
ncbi:MAG: AAA family ATPase [Candidatus Omnitrophota bacterium]